MQIDSTTRSQLLSLGLGSSDGMSWNASTSELYELAIMRGEAQVAEGGSLVVTTGSHTGRSPQDKFIVRDAATENTIWWDNNRAMTRAQFQALKQDFLVHARNSNLFIQDLIAGADPLHELPTRVICENAWHALFIQHLLIAPESGKNFAPGLTIIDLPSFKADPQRHGTRGQTVIAFDLTNGLVLIGGTQYAGEIKKSVFTVLNYLLPEKGVMPMHCSANMGAANDTTVFFGLSGTGKTTLSADASRTLIGDDEHGWSEKGVFNFEGGCYAKVINLSAEAEPEIFATTKRWGTVLENVVMDPKTRKLDLADNALTENTRAAYPLNYIPNASASGQARRAKKHCDAHRRCLRCVATIGKAHAAAGHVSLSLRLHCKSGWNRTGRSGTHRHFLYLFWRALYSAPPQPVWKPSARSHRHSQCHVLAGEHRLDRRGLRRGQPHADPGNPRPSCRCDEW